MTTLKFQKIFLISLLFPLLFLSACSELKVTLSKQETEEVIIYHEVQEIEALFYHEHENYSVAYLEDNIVKFKKLPFYETNGLKAQIIRDVPKGEKSWYEVKYQQINNKSLMRKRNKYGKIIIEPILQIHISDVSEINGAGWDHGKFGSGLTVKING